MQGVECDCRTESGTTRVYLGVDGVMVPLVTDEEKQKRRAAVKRKRQRSGRKCGPLPARKIGADQAYKEFKVVTFYDEEHQRRYVAGRERQPHGRRPHDGTHVRAGRLLAGRGKNRQRGQPSTPKQINPARIPGQHPERITPDCLTARRKKG